MVVTVPDSMPNPSSSNFITGMMRLVAQDAFDTILSCAVRCQAVNAVDNGGIRSLPPGWENNSTFSRRRRYVPARHHGSRTPLQSSTTSTPSSARRRLVNIRFMRDADSVITDFQHIFFFQFNRFKSVRGLCHIEVSVQYLRNPPAH